jgi:hypothetical protein
MITFQRYARTAILLLLFGFATVARQRCYGSDMRGRHAHTLLHFSSPYARLAGRLPETEALDVILRQKSNFLRYLITLDV